MIWIQENNSDIDKRELNREKPNESKKEVQIGES